MSESRQQLQAEPLTQGQTPMPAVAGPLLFQYDRDTLRPLACGGHAPHFVGEPDHRAPGIVRPLPGTIRRALDKSVAAHYLYCHGRKRTRKTDNCWLGEHILSRLWRQTPWRQETASSSHCRNVLAGARGGTKVAILLLYHKVFSNSQGNKKELIRFPRGRTPKTTSGRCPPAIASEPATAEAPEDWLHMSAVLTLSKSSRSCSRVVLNPSEAAIVVN